MVDETLGALTMVREVRLVLTVLFACVMTGVLFKKEREYEDFSFADAQILIATGEYHGYGRGWDRAVGLLPYAYYKKWEKPQGVISRWEEVSYDATNFKLCALLAGLCWCPVGLSVCRCFHPWDAKPTGPPVESKRTVPDDGELLVSG